MKKEGRAYVLTVNGTVYDSLSRESFYNALRILRKHRCSTVITHHVSEYGSYVCITGCSDPCVEETAMYLRKLKEAKQSQ